MEVIPFPYKRRLDAEPKNEASPPCIACGNPGPLTPMFTNVKPNLCQEHYIEVIAALAEVQETQ